MSTCFNSIVTDFDFDKVRKVMELFDWKWSFFETKESCVPNIDEMKSMVYALRHDVEKALQNKDSTYVRSGGFCVYGRVENDKIEYRLVFELESQG